MTAGAVKTNTLRVNRDGSIAGPVDAQDTGDELDRLARSYSVRHGVDSGAGFLARSGTA